MHSPAGRLCQSPRALAILARVPRLPAERIAIVKLGALGDVVNSLPFVNRLRAGYPDAKLSWIIGPAAHALVRGHRAVDEFRVFDVRHKSSWPFFVRELRAQRFDLAIDLQRILKSGLITRASGAPLRLGFDRARCKEQSHVFCNRRIPANAHPGVTVAQYLEFADYLECPAQEPRWDLPLAPVPAPEQGERRVVIAVGATKSANRWSSAQWARLAQRLVRECGVRVHLIGGAEDRAAIDELKKHTLVELVDHAGRLTLQESAGLLAGAELCVCGDTGPLHMAVALGRPVVALFGAADPARTGPFGQPHNVVRHAVECSPCRKRECAVVGHPCMRDLSVETVFAAAARVLGERQPAISSS